MARTLYGASPADYFIDAGGTPNKNATASVWTTRTGGLQVTDLQSVDGTSIAVVVADNYGGFRFYGPDGFKTTLWIEGAVAGLRYKADPVDVADRLIALEGEVVRSIDGATPDDAGAVTIGAVRTINGNGPDAVGDIKITTGTATGGSGSAIVTYADTATALARITDGTVPDQGLFAVKAP